MKGYVVLALMLCLSLMLCVQTVDARGRDCGSGTCNQVQPQKDLTIILPSPAPTVTPVPSVCTPEVCTPDACAPAACTAASNEGAKRHPILRVLKFAVKGPAKILKGTLKGTAKLVIRRKC